MMFREQNETGESVRSINKRGDDLVQDRVLSALRRGAVLIIHRKINRAVVEGIDDRDRDYGITLSLTRVRRLEKEGYLEHIGVDKYAATERKIDLFS